MCTGPHVAWQAWQAWQVVASTASLKPPICCAWPLIASLISEAESVSYSMSACTRKIRHIYT